MADTQTLDYLLRCADERTFGAHGHDDADCAALAAHLRRLRALDAAVARWWDDGDDDALYSAVFPVDADPTAPARAETDDDTR